MLLPSALPYADISAARYIYLPSRGEAAVIEAQTHTRGSDGTQRLIRGSMLESILGARVISEEETLSGRAEAIARTLVTKYALTGAKAIYGLSLGDAVSYTQSSEVAAIGDFLSEKLYATLNAVSLSYRTVMDFPARTIKFEVYGGLDRTTSQSDNDCAIFSESFGSLASYTLSAPVTGFYSYVYIDGADGNATLDLTGGGERRELYIFANKLRKNGLSEAAYTSLLRSYAAERVKAANDRLTLSAVINPKVAPFYKSGYDLGDICELECPSAGISAKARITAVTERYERGEYSLEADFTGI